jgi:purine catabolism regulator
LDPAGSVDRDWVLLTTGLQLGASKQADRAFVGELVDAGVAALGFALGVVRSEVPDGIVAAARKLDFPVFTVPACTPIRELTSFVFKGVLSSEVRASYRLVSMQRFLMACLSDEVPRDGLLSRLASRLDAAVGMIGAGGQPVFETRPLPCEAISELLGTDGVSRIVPIDVAGLHGFALPVSDDLANAHAWLVLTWPAGRSIPAVARPAAQVAVPLLEATMRLSRAEIAQTRAVRRATLEALIEPDSVDDRPTLNGRCDAYGLDLDGGIRAVAISDSAGAVDPSLLLDCEVALECTRVPFLAAQLGDKIAVLVPAEVTDEFVAQNLLGHPHSVRAGIGRAVFDGLDVPKSWADAELAADQRTRRAWRTRTKITRYDDLDLGTVLLNEVPLDRLAPKIGQLLAPLRTNPLIYETLVSYLRLDQDVGRTARTLHLHPNSVRYRLSRAEEILGASIRSSATILALHVALALDDANPTDDTQPDYGPPAEIVELVPA